MSLHNQSMINDKDEVSTEKMNTTILTSNLQPENQQIYEEQFTLMAKPNLPTPPQPSFEKCLAYKVAQRFPPGIREQATKIVKYYEISLQSHIKEYHKLMEANNKLKKQNDKLMVENILKNEVVLAQKENQASKTQNIQKTPDRLNYRKRIEELEDKVILRDQKINILNGEVSDLTLKLRKYKKRFETTGIKE